MGKTATTTTTAVCTCSQGGWVGEGLRGEMKVQAKERLMQVHSRERNGRNDEEPTAI
jgi:hypothetical protein